MSTQRPGMASLTPYDTGAVAEPHVWKDDDPTTIGNVDFDDDEGTTICTVRVVRDGSAYYAIITSARGEERRLVSEVDGDE